MEDLSPRMDYSEFVDTAVGVAPALQALGKAVDASGLEKPLTELVKLRASQKSTLKVGACTLDLARGMLHSQGLHVRLTSREATLARLLFERCNEVVTTGQLCEALCGRIDAGAERAVKQHAYVLRRKLQQVASSDAEPLRIETVYGKGYQLVW